MNFLNKKIFLPILGISLLIGGISINANTRISFANAAPNEINMPTTLNIKRNTESEIRNYYSSLNSLSSSELKGTNLLKNLKTILQKNMTYLNYDNVWKSACITERDWVRSPASTLTGTYNSSTGAVSNYRPYKTTNGDDPYLIVMYRNDNGSHDVKISSPHNNSGGINREHTWPQSRGVKGDPATGPAGTDLHHLIIAEALINQDAHKNNPYGEVDVNNYTAASFVSGNKKGKNNKYGDNNVFEPADEYKGDIARMCFYMVARYNNFAKTSGAISTYDANLTLNDSGYDTNGSSHSSDNTSINLSYLYYLLKWHEEDPVSDFEIYRNDLIYKNFQNNRNPFIDYPSWVDIAFGNSSDYAKPSTDTLHAENNEPSEPSNPSSEPSSETPSFSEEPSSEPSSEEPSSEVINEPTVINKAPTIGKEYLLGFVQKNLGKIFFINGSLSNYYAATTNDVNEAAIVKVESANGGYYIKCNSSYLNIVTSGRFNNINFQNSPSTIWVYNSTYNTMTTTINSNTYFLGTYDRYSTLSCSTISYIESNFPARFYELNASSSSSENPSSSSSQTPVEPDVPSEYKTMTLAKGSHYSFYNEKYTGYSSSNTNVLTISKYGEASALNTGYSDISFNGSDDKIRVYVKESISDNEGLKTLQDYNVAYSDFTSGSYAIGTENHFVYGDTISSGKFKTYSLSSYALTNDELNKLRFDFEKVDNGYSIKNPTNGYINVNSGTNFNYDNSNYISFTPNAVNDQEYAFNFINGSRAIAYSAITDGFKYYATSNMTNSNYDFTLYLKRFEFAIDELTSLLTKMDCDDMSNYDKLNRVNYLYNLLTENEKQNMSNYEVVANDGKTYTLQYIYEYVLAYKTSSEIATNLLIKQIDYIPIAIIVIVSITVTIVYLTTKKQRLCKK